MADGIGMAAEKEMAAEIETMAVVVVVRVEMCKLGYTDNLGYGRDERPRQPREEQPLRNDPPAEGGSSGEFKCLSPRH